MLIGLLHRLVRLRLRMLGFRSSWINLPTCRVHFYSYHHPTCADTLVLLHGVGTSSSTWLYLYPFLIRKYSVVAIDLPGFGFSRVVNSKGFLTLHDHVAAVERCSEHLDRPHSTILLGHSFGGWIAMLCALQTPDRIKSLVLINPAGVYTEGVEGLGQLFAVQTTADVRNLMMRMWYCYPWYFKPFLSAIGEELLARNVPALIGSIRREEFVNDRLRELSMPVHLIWGREDRLLSEQTVQVLEQTVNRLTVDYIPECGHVPQLEKPRELVLLLQKILRMDGEEESIAHHTAATALRQ